MEGEAWVKAALQVLSPLPSQPMHHSSIKKLILEQGLVGPGLKMKLESALWAEAQRPASNLRAITHKPGYFALKPEQEVKQMAPPSTQSPARNPPRARVTGHHGNMNGINKHETKYRRLKKIVKDMIFMNAAVCDEVVRMEEKVLHAKEERRYLLRRLLQHQGAPSEIVSQASARPSPQAAPPMMPPKPTSQSIAQILGEVEKRKKKSSGGGGGGASGTPVGSSAGGATSGVAVGSKKKTTRELLEESLAPKSKKSKSQSNKRLVEPIPLDNLGRPIFPIELGNLSVHCLGEIVYDRPAYYRPEYIYPSGYCSTRMYASTRAAELSCLYTCKITDEGARPKFEISPEDSADVTFVANSPHECHAQLIQAVNQTRGTNMVAPPSKGPEFFGISHPTIQNLIQSCPGARKCTTYKWIRFEVPRDGISNYVEEDPSVNILVLAKMQQSAPETQDVSPQTKQSPSASAPAKPGSGSAPAKQGPGSASLRNLLTNAQFTQAMKTS